MPTLSDLPSEIRQQIWRECVASSRNRIDLADGYAKYKLHLGLFRVNRTVYHEARTVFRRENVFCRIVTPWHSSQEYIAVNGRVPLLITGKHAVDFTDVHLLVTLDFPGSPRPAEMCSYCIICDDDLPAFCKLWQYVELTHEAMNQHFGLRLQLRNPNPDPASTEDRDLPRAMQLRLLNPFINVKRLASISVEGKVDDSVKAGFLDRIKEPYESPESCLARTGALTHQGNAALKENRPADAIRCYEEAFRAMFIIVNGRARDEWGEAHFDQTMSGGRHDGQPGNFIRLLFRIELTSMIIAAYNKLGDYTSAYFWGNRSITLARTRFGDSVEVPQADFPNANGWGRVWLRTAIASRELGKMDEAYDQFTIAWSWMPEDDAEFKEAWPAFENMAFPAPSAGFDEAERLPSVYDELDSDGPPDGFAQAQQLPSVYDEMRRNPEAHQE